MAYEVELKFLLEDATVVLKSLKQLNAVRKSTEHQVDRYFNHPSRDFAVTDEALRIRTIGHSTRMTYKGPLIDDKTKSRYEIELPVGNCEVENEHALAEMFIRLGFTETRSVVKDRTTYHLEWNGREYEVAFDVVSNLGNFLEIETQAEEGQQLNARDSILKLATLLELHNSQRKSYLHMLIDQDGRFSF